MRARECGCPPWVEQCAHWDRQIINIGGPIQLHFHNHGDWLDTSFSVRTTLGFEPCPKAGCPAILIDGNRTDRLFLDQQAARAEFDRRAAQLVGGAE